LVRELRAAALTIAPCRACGGCDQTGECIVRDGMTEVFEAVRWADALAVATPVFFASVTAQLKAVVDRFQCAWVAKHRLGRPWVDPAEHRAAALLTVGGMKIGSHYTQAEQVLRTWLSVISFEPRVSLVFHGVDDAGAIQLVPGLHGQVAEAAAGFVAAAREGMGPPGR